MALWPPENNRENAILDGEGNLRNMPLCLSWRTTASAVELAGIVIAIMKVDHPLDFPELAGRHVA